MKGFIEKAWNVFNKKVSKIIVYFFNPDKESV